MGTWANDITVSFFIKLVTVITHTHTHTRRMGIFTSTLGVWGRRRSWVKWASTRLATPYLRTRIMSPLFHFSLPSSLSENNNGTSTAFEGWLNSSNSYCFCRISGQLRVSPQLHKQLSVEGGCLGLSCYLNPEGKGWGGVTLNHTLYNELLTPMGLTGKCVARLLVKQGWLM